MLVFQIGILTKFYYPYKTKKKEMQITKIQQNHQ